ncbi:hypothetical protein CUJ86_09700 [Methanofollis fontis]|uniref:Fido domain-containing protein n=2 Tax=Methanofollis fontis TaxID=2052832 RepID=A0A483CX17_9EURY|nr:hypothetical protein CUJ86_09700 [Methanofollis fontis]
MAWTHSARSWTPGAEPSHDTRVEGGVLNSFWTSWVCEINTYKCSYTQPEKERSMVDLTVKMIIEVQIHIIMASKHQEDEGTEGLVRDHGTLDYLVDEMNYINDSCTKAALMLHGIASRHPFYQGNKRTALAIAEIILMLEGGWYIAAEDEAIDLYVREVACYQHDLNEVKCWLQKNCQKM